MQYLIIGKDGTDDKAMERRLAVRDQHIKFGDEMESAGNRWYGAALLDDDGKMIGSFALMDFPNEDELQKYLDNEPYVKGNVWQDIEVIKCNVKNPWKFNRPEQFFVDRGYKKIN